MGCLTATSLGRSDLFSINDEDGDEAEGGLHAGAAPDCGASIAKRPVARHCSLLPLRGDRSDRFSQGIDDSRYRLYKNSTYACIREPGVRVEARSDAEVNACS